MIDKDGIVLDGVNAQTNKPFTLKECKTVFKEIDAPNRHKRLYLNYEDSIMATADYMSAQLYRYLTTSEGDAYEIAMRCYTALKKISQQGNKQSIGFLPKPYGGIKDTAKSKETSADQYCKAVLAFHQLYEMTSDTKIKKEIKDSIISWADWWESHNFATMYFKQFTVWTYSHPIAFFLYLMELAYRFSRRKIFRCWYDVFYERRNWLTKIPYCSGNMGNMIIRSLHQLIKLRPEHNAIWKKAIRYNYKLCLKSLHNPTGYAKPNPPHDKNLKYLHGVSTLVASNAVYYAEIFNQYQPIQIAEKILTKTAKSGIILHTKFLTTPQKKNIETPIKKVSGYYMAGWQLAYWHKRYISSD